MSKTLLTFLTPSTRQAVQELSQECGLHDPMVFVRKAVEDKLRALRSQEFFSISEKVRKGLLKRGISPSRLLKTFKT